MIKKAYNFASRYSHINWALADQAMVSGSNFVTGILLARTLGIAEFGRFTLAWMVVLFVQSIQHAAINAPMMSIGPKQEASEKSAYFGAVFLQQFIFAILSAVLTFLGIKASAVFFPDWGAEPLVLPLTAVVFFSQIQDFLRRYYFTIETPAKSFISDFIRYIGQITVLFVLLLSMQQAITTSMAIWVMVGTSSAAILLILIKLPDISWTAHSWHTVISRHWHFSKWLIGSAVMQWTTGNMFIIVAGVMLGSVAVGALKAAQSLVGLLHILFFGLENIAPIQAAKVLSSKGMAAFRIYLIKIILFTGVPTILYIGILSIAPTFWMSQIFGETFSQYGFVLFWYGMLYILFGFGVFIMVGLRTLEKTKPIFTAKFIATIFTIALCYPFIAYFGLPGVLAGMILAQIIERAWLAFFLVRYNFSKENKA